MTDSEIGSDYLRVKLHLALVNLMTGNAPPEERLEPPLVNLMGVLRREHFLTEEEFVRWTAIKERLTALEGTVAEGGVEATTRQMNRHQLRAVIEEILDLHERHIVALTRQELPPE